MEEPMETDSNPQFTENHVPEDKTETIVQCKSVEIKEADSAEILEQTEVPSAISNDIHEEINRKLEELENLTGGEALVNTTEDPQPENVSTLSESGVFLENEVCDTPTEADSCTTVETSEVIKDSDIENAVETVIDKEAEAVTNLEEVSQDESNVNTNEESTVTLNEETTVNLNEESSVNLNEESTANLNDESTGEMRDESSVNINDEQDTQSQVETVEIETIESEVEAQPDSTESAATEKEQDVSEITEKDSNQTSDSLEEKIKIIVESEGNATTDNESMEKSDKDLKDDSVNLQSEEIEITEVTATDVVEGEEVPIEYTVITDDENSQQEIEITQSFETDNSNTQEETVIIDNGLATEEIVFVEELDTVEDSVSTETKQQVADNELFIVTHEAEPESDPLQTPKEVKPKKPRGRRPINSIPSHVMGVDLNNPAADAALNGSGRPLKPRLGVKVPYRNLSSQIVSKEEIQEEIMERFRQKQVAQAKERHNLVFARKLTQRLASKIAPDIKPELNINFTKSPQSTSTPIKLPASTSRIEKDSDLLAILEGDDDDIPPSEEHLKKEREDAERKMKQLEREIALKQLEDLPNIPPHISSKSSKHKFEDRAKDKSKSQSTKIIKSTSSSSKTDSTSSLKPKSKSDSTSQPVKKIQDVEPQLKPSMALKTYSRKRKSTEETPIGVKKIITEVQKGDKMQPPGPADKSKVEKKVNSTSDTKTEKKPEQKSEIPLPTNAYVTKSSRVIKKKVIWDPDEVVTPRSSIKSPKPADAPASAKPTPSTPKAADKPVDKKTPQEKKVIEKKPMEKKLVAKKSISPKKGKRLSEIDRLLMDEGAINMLYEVKNTEDTQTKLKKKTKTVISIEKAEKVLRNKANELLKDLKQNTAEESHKSLRRKESPPETKKEIVPGAIMRKKSKDSTRSSVHSPPASPAFPYESSRLIRRHSSSSFSSGDEGSETSEKVAKKKLPPPTDAPKAKKKKTIAEAVVQLQKPKVVKDIVKTAAKEVPVTATSGAKQKEPQQETKVVSTKQFTLKRTAKVVTIKLNYGEGSPYLSAQIMKDLTGSLNRLAKDENCSGVVITSTSSAYCLGINYQLLVASNPEERKKKATALATNMREFLKCLLYFPKVLVAGVQGDCVGLGVTMLSLFDMVVASDKAQFSMPYGTLGCMPEAAFLLTAPHINCHGLASELFYTASDLSASEVARHGLVTRLCWPEKYNDELKTICMSVSAQSLRTIETVKKQLRQGLLLTTEADIVSQTKALIEHWTSDECQNSFANIKTEKE